MKYTPRFLPAFVALGALLAAGCGESDDDGDSRSAAAGNPVDRAFVAQMIPHHESAVAMAQTAQRRATSAFVKQLADDIVRSQTEEISTMRAADQRLRRAGVTNGSLGVPDHMTGMDGDTSALKTANPFDRAFLRMMIPHHEGAVVMANAELDKGQDPELETLAQEIITAQKREISQMREHLGEAGDAEMDETEGHHGAVAPAPRGRDRIGQGHATRARGQGVRDMPYAHVPR